MPTGGCYVPLCAFHARAIASALAIWSVVMAAARDCLLLAAAARKSYAG